MTAGRSESMANVVITQSATKALETVNSRQTKWVHSDEGQKLLHHIIICIDFFPFLVNLI